MSYRKITGHAEASVKLSRCRNGGLLAMSIDHLRLSQEVLGHLQAAFLE